MPKKIRVKKPEGNSQEEDDVSTVKTDKEIVWTITEGPAGNLREAVLLDLQIVEEEEIDRLRCPWTYEGKISREETTGSHLH